MPKQILTPDENIIIGYLTEDAIDLFGQVLLTKDMPLSLTIKNRLNHLYVAVKYRPIAAVSPSVICKIQPSTPKPSNQKPILEIAKPLDQKFDFIDASVATTASSYLNDLLKLLRQDDFFYNNLRTLSINNMTYSHSVNVAILSTIFGQRLNFSAKDLQDLALAALFHDIGVILLPPEVKLSIARIDDQAEVLYRQHPRLGANLLKYDRLPASIYNAILQHHEKYNGSGYPAALHGHEILLNASIINIVDTFDLLTTSIYQRQALDPQQALKRITFCAGTDFAAKITQTFCSFFTI